MIATLEGKLSHRGLEQVVIDVGGVGYEVHVSNDTLARLPELGEEVFLHIHTNVREDAFTLFGFLGGDEKEMFLILKTVSGIGPKLALSVLSGMRVPDLCQAIGQRDIQRLTALQGIGKKTAERLCVDLKDKVAHLGSVTIEVESSDPGVAASSVQVDAISALVNLGYPDPVARRALVAVKKRVGEEAFVGMNLEELLREGLRALA